MESRSRIQGAEGNAGDDPCGNHTGDGMPGFSPLSTTQSRWPLQDISNLYSVDVGDPAFETEASATNTPIRQSNRENSPPMQRNGASPRTPGSGRGNSGLRRGFR